MRSTPLKGWRRIAGAMWDAPKDPQIYGAIDVDARPIRAFIEQAHARGHKLTPTHLVGRATARAVAACPELNGRIVFGRFSPRDTIDVFFHVALEGGDLSGVKIENADRKSAVELAAELNARASRAKSGNDPAFQKTKRAMNALPMPLLRALVRFSSFVATDLDLSVPALGLERRPFGSASVTSIGMLGLPAGFGPLTHTAHVPLLVLVGEIVDKPVAEDGQAVVRPVLPISATIDHRYVDGWHLARLFEAFRGYLADPAAFEPALS